MIRFLGSFFREYGSLLLAQPLSLEGKSQPSHSPPTMLSEPKQGTRSAIICPLTRRSTRRIFDVDGPGVRQTLHGLFDDASALLQLSHAHEEAVSAVADTSYRNLEVDLGIAQVRVCFAHVVWHVARRRQGSVQPSEIASAAFITPTPSNRS